jgi:hypothetical protein
MESEIAQDDAPDPRLPQVVDGELAPDSLIGW